jgi:TonB family protein
MRLFRYVSLVHVIVPLTCLAATAAAQGTRTPPRLVAAQLDSAPWSVQSGGISACEVKLDERGTVTSVEIVQDVPPYGAALADGVRGWQFEPARDGGRAVPSHVLVLGFFRPPALTFAAPASPRYKTTVAPDEIPWPTSVTVPPYPPNALGSGRVVLEVDVSEGGAVTHTRVLSTAGAFDGAAAQAVQKWTFRPARRQGRDVPSRAFMVVSFVGTTP